MNEDIKKTRKSNRINRDLSLVALGISIASLIFSIAGKLL